MQSENYPKRSEDAPQAADVKPRIVDPEVAVGYQHAGQASAEQAIESDSLSGTKLESKAPLLRTLQDRRRDQPWRAL